MRITKIEGWLSVQEGERTDADKSMQKLLQAEDKKAAAESQQIEEKKATPDGEQAADKKSTPETQKIARDAFHLIGFKIGGPTEGVMGDARINRSFMGFEREAQSRLEAGEQLYCQVELRWDGDKKDPTHLTHRFFTAGEDGSPKFLAEVETKIDKRPSMTVRQALDAVNSGLTVKEWNSFEPHKSRMH